MYKQGEILLIPIPFSDLTSYKKRPVLVMSRNEYNKRTNDLVVVAITSNITEKEYTILLTNEEMEEGRLMMDSCIRVDKVYTLSQNIVISRFGAVKSEVMDCVRKKLMELI